MGKHDKHIGKISAILFICSIVINFIGGGVIPFGPLQNFFFELGSLCAIGGYATIAGKLNRENHDLLVAGFTVLTVAEGFSIASVADSYKPNVSSFAACLALYSLGFLIIGVFSHFKWWVRTACILITIPFGIDTYGILTKTLQDYLIPFKLVGYCLQTVAIIGWILYLLGPEEKKQVS